MQITNIRELKTNTKKVLATMTQKGPIVLTRRGIPVALMRSLGSKELDIRFSPLWERIRISAETAGYKPKDINRLIVSARSER